MTKKILHTVLTLAAALTLMGGFSMTAYAGGGEEYETETQTEPEETPTPSDPLTPEGNASLVDDIWGENKQLITVTTKNGNYFYILIDRAQEDETAVHFLNQVDEADLMALIEDGETEAETPVMPQTCVCVNKCEPGAVNESCPVCLNNLHSCIGTEKEAEPEETTEPEPEAKSGGAKGLLLLFLVCVFAGGGAFYYFKFIKPKDAGNTTPDFSEFDFEDEDEDSDYEDEIGDEDTENGEPEDEIEDGDTDTTDPDDTGEDV